MNLEVGRLIREREETLPGRTRQLAEDLQSDALNLRELTLALERELGGPREGSIPYTPPETKR